jgi:formylglycine-generating enzyme required for sulfatase activity
MDTEDLINAKTLIDTSIDRGYRFPEGSEFDQYLLRSQLGRGALGEVYEAEHKVLGKFFALKILKIDLKSSSGLKKSFEREARVMASLEHPRILKVDDFRITDDLPWLRMELCRGFKKDMVTLAHFDEKNAGKINEAELIEILQQILDGLEYAHGRGVIHRDLKPANILLFPGKDCIPEIKIADFGLVKMVGEEWLHSQAQMSLTQSMGVSAIEQGKEGGSATRSLVGTWEYMSPERQEGKEADANDDCYAVALMAWKLLTGYRRPGFERASELSNADPIWDTFFSKALSMRKEKRFETAKQMSQHLEELGEALESEEKPVIKPTIEKPVNKGENEQKSEEEKGKGDPPAKEPESEKEKPDPPVLEKPSEEPTNEALPIPVLEKPPGNTATRWGRIKTSTLVLLLCLMGIWLYETLVSHSKPESSASGRKQKFTPILAQSRKAKSEKPSEPKEDPIKGKKALSPTYTNSIGMEFMRIPAGTFTMGAPRWEQEEAYNQCVEQKLDERVCEGWDLGESNQTGVEITRPFYMGKYEVTQGHWKEVMGWDSWKVSEEFKKDGKRFKDMVGSNLPVVFVSWKDVQRFVKKLNNREGCKEVIQDYDSGSRAFFSLKAGCYRLPTEAEWEYAARAGTNTVNYWGNDHDKACDYANVASQAAERLRNHSWVFSHNCDDGFPELSPVGSFKPNAFGLHDTIGNVWEWVFDWYSGIYYRLSSSKDPVNLKKGSGRVYRGGSWFSSSRGCRSADRARNSPGYRNGSIGFRLLRTP